MDRTSVPPPQVSVPGSQEVHWILLPVEEQQQLLSENLGARGRSVALSYSSNKNRESVVEASDENHCEKFLGCKSGVSQLLICSNILRVKRSQDHAGEI
jgi:hypothetical protein